MVFLCALQHNFMKLWLYHPQGLEYKEGWIFVLQYQNAT